MTLAMMMVLSRNTETPSLLSWRCSTARPCPRDSAEGPLLPARALAIPQKAVANLQQAVANLQQAVAKLQQALAMLQRVSRGHAHARCCLMIMWFSSAYRSMVLEIGLTSFSRTTHCPWLSLCV